MSIGVKIEAQYGQMEAATEKLRTVFGGAMQSMRDNLKSMADQAKIDMKGHESAAAQMATVLKSHMKGVEGAVKAVKIAWAQLAVIFEAGRFMKEAVTDTVQMTVEAQKMGRTLGISATQASYLNVALKGVHATSEEYISAVKGLDTQVRKHEGAVKAMGLETRDANGHLKDQQTLMLEALDTLRDYKEGTDRNLAAQVLFGKGVEVSSEMMGLNSEKMKEAKVHADALGLAVGSDDVEAADKFRSAMVDMKEIMEAVMKAIGSALLPVLNDLAEWFINYGPTAINALKIALDIVISVFDGLTLAVKVLWELVSLAFNNMTTVAGGFAKVFVALFKGDFSGAKAAAEEAFHGIQANAGAAFDNIIADATKTGDAMTAMWSPLINGTAAKDSGVVGKGDKDFDPESKEKKGHASKDNSAAEAKREAAEAARLRKEAFDALMESFKLEETAAGEHWDKVLEIQKKELADAVVLYGENSKEAMAIQNKILETEKKAAEQHAALEVMKAEATRRSAFSRIDAEEKTAQAQERMGLMTMQELIRQEQVYEDERYALARKALQDEAAANVERVLDHQRTLDKMEELDAAHADRVAQIANRVAIDAAAPAEAVARTMQQSMEGAFTGILTGATTLKQGLASIWKATFSAFVSEMISKPLAEWAAGLARRLVLEKVFHLKKTVLEKVSAAQQIVAAAAVAGANGVASYALAPWPVDMGAPAFGLAMAGAASGFGAGVAAEGGFDIPAGMNPITQLHQKEMVLPAEHADTIRSMAGGASGGDTHHYHIAANDAQSFVDMLKRNPQAMVDAGRHARRNGYSVAF